MLTVLGTRVLYKGSGERQQVCSCIIKQQITEQRWNTTKCNDQNVRYTPNSVDTFSLTLQNAQGLWQASSKGSKVICHLANKVSLFRTSLHQDAWLQSSAAPLVRILFDVKLQFRLPYSLGYRHLHGDSHKKLLDIGSLKSTSLNKNCTMLVGIRLSSC